MLITTTKIRAIAAASVIAALSSASVASAMSIPHPVTQVKPIATIHHQPVAAVSAFPTGGKGSGTEATCALWSQQLNGDAGGVAAAEANNDLSQYQDATAALNEDKSNAEDAGCVVID